MNYKDLLLFICCCEDNTGNYCPYSVVYGSFRDRLFTVYGVARTWCHDCNGCKIEDMCFTALEMGWD